MKTIKLKKEKTRIKKKHKTIKLKKQLLKH